MNAANLIPLFNTDGRSTSPLGLPMNQNRLAVPVWSYVMEIYPPNQIVEIGTAGGGLTTALGIHAYRIGCKIDSFDICAAPNEDWKHLAEFLGVKFHRCDIFEKAPSEYCCDLIAKPGVAFLLCDGGSKIKEFNSFASAVKPGDVIAAHDYYCGQTFWPWSEVDKSDIVDAVIRYDLEPFMQDYFDTCGWIAYRKRA